MNALFILAGLVLFVIAIVWQLAAWLGFWRFLGLVGVGEAASAAKSLKRQSLAAEALATELRLMRQEREKRLPPTDATGPGTHSTPFDDDPALAALWREQSRRGRKNGRRP